MEGPHTEGTWMYIDLIIWDDEDDPGGNYRHIVGAGDVTAEEVDEVLHGHPGDGPDGYSESSGLPLVFGWTGSGKYIVVIYRDEGDDDLVIIRPVTAYPVPE
jgi:hypothetical protein